MRFTSPFEAEVTEAARYYASIDGVLVRRFLDQLDEAVDTIDRFPNVGKSANGYRVLPLKGFPLSICYEVTSEGPLAYVLHHHKSLWPMPKRRS